jgi:hypothetical protein
MRLSGLETLTFKEMNRPFASHSAVTKDSSGVSHVNLTSRKSVAVEPKVINVRTNKNMNQQLITKKYE